jgi:hypothetical protein
MALSRYRRRCEIFEESPQRLFLPSLILPLVRRLWEQINNIENPHIMSKYKEYVILCVCFLRLLDTLDRPRYVDSEDWVKESLIGLATSFHVQLAKYGAVKKGIPLEGTRLRELHLIWNWKIGRRSDFSSMMTNIAAHENESVRIGRRSSEACHVANSMAGCVEKEERAISEKVHRTESAKEGGFVAGKVYFSHTPAPDNSLELVCPRCLLETRIEEGYSSLKVSLW